MGTPLATLEAKFDMQDPAVSLFGKRLPFSEIPVIDFGPFLNGADEAREEVAARIGAACREAGFFYLKNHGIPDELFDRVYAEARRFFSLPESKKREVYVGLTDRVRGYSPHLEEKLSKKGDLKEAFDLALEIPEDDPDRLLGARLYGPNLWPADLPGFRETIYDDYFLRVMELGKQVLQAFALALSLPDDYFNKFTHKPLSNLRVLYYPPQLGPIDPDMLGCGAHTDYECFTLLAQTDAGGLQVQNAGGEWVEAPPIPGTFVVNIGDMMARWTNDVFASTPHRVINRSGRERFSLPFFFGADYWAPLACLPTCQSPSNPPKYPSVKAGDYLCSRYDSTFTSLEHNESAVEGPPKPDRQVKPHAIKVV